MSRDRLDMSRDRPRSVAARRRPAGRRPGPAPPVPWDSECAGNCRCPHAADKGLSVSDVHGQATQTRCGQVLPMLLRRRSETRNVPYAGEGRGLGSGIGWHYGEDITLRGSEAPNASTILYKRLACLFSLSVFDASSATCLSFIHDSGRMTPGHGLCMNSKLLKGKLYF